MAEVQLAMLAAEAREAIDSEDLARAADACRRALLHFPRWVEGYWLLGHILVESGYVPQARSCFEAVASALPDDPRAYQGLADAAEQQHDLPTAVAGLVRALEVGENSQSVQAELRRLQAQAGYVVDTPFTNARVAHARLLAGEYEEADVTAERALQEEPERLDQLVVQAVARLFGGDRRGSENVCRQLLDLSPDCLKALTILRYLLPGEQTAGLGADLAALDPEGQTLVWLRGQMTTLGYDADDLPASPKLVAWQEDEEVVGRDGRREIRPLDRLIPELEEVWPQWLRQAALTTPEAPAGEHSGQAEVPPPPQFATEPEPANAPATPSFLGDVDTLAREFEDAMRPAKVEAPPTPVEHDDQIAAASNQEASVAPVAEWSVTQAAGEAGGEEADAVSQASERQTAITPSAPTRDEFAQWTTPDPCQSPRISDEGSTVAQPAADAAEMTPPVKAVSAIAADGWGAAARPEGAAPAEAGQAPARPAAETTAVDEPTTPVVVPPVAEQPETDAPDDSATLRAAGQKAMAAGEYWAAIDHFGALLATMQATPQGRG